MAEKQNEALASLSADNPTAVIQTEMATVTATMLVVDESAAVQDESGVARMEVGVEGSPVKAAMPMDLLSTLPAGAAAVFTVFDNSALKAAMGNESTLDESGEPVEVAGVMMFEISVGGQSHKVSELADPILLTLPANGTDGEECSYWDDTQKLWSKEGVSSSIDENGGLVCAVSHLSMFGAVSGGFANALACANLKVFTPEGLKALGRGDWWHWPSAIGLFCIISLHLFLFAMAFYTDYKLVPKLGEQRGSLGFITSHPNYEQHKEKVGIKQRAHEVFHDVHEQFASVKNIFTQSYSPCGKIFEHVMVLIVVLVVQVSFAARFNVDLRDVRNVQRKTKQMVKGEEKRIARASTVTMTRGGSSQSLSSNAEPTASIMSQFSRSAKTLDTSGLTKFYGYQQTMHEKMDEHVTDLFNGYMTISAFSKKIWALFSAMQPWLVTTHHSIYIPASLRVLLLSARVFGTLMLSGVFFTASGNSDSADAPPECTSGDFVTKLSMTFAVAVISSMCSVVPLAMMLMLRKRDIVYIAEDDHKKRNNLILKWKVEDVVLWSFGGFYTLASILFTLSFLANVTLNDHWNFLVAASTSLCKQMLLTPLAISTFLAIVATLGLSSANIQEKARHKLMIPAEEPDEVPNAYHSHESRSSADLVRHQSTLRGNTVNSFDGEAMVTRQQSTVSDRSISDEAMELRIGDRIQVLPGRSYQPNGQDIHRENDLGTITSFYIDRGAQRFCIEWDRSGRTSDMRVATWRKWFRYVGEIDDADILLQTPSEDPITLQVGDRLRVLPGRAYQPKGEDIHKEGDVGTVSNFYQDEVGEERFCVLWDRSGCSSDMRVTAWRNWFSFAGRAQQYIANETARMGDASANLPYMTPSRSQLQVSGIPRQETRLQLQLSLPESVLSTPRLFPQTLSGTPRQETGQEETVILRIGGREQEVKINPSQC